MKANADVLIIGGGASGMAAAVSAAASGESVLLLEKEDRLGRKLSATGNGRCNLMNSGDPRYYGSPEFARQVLGLCGVPELKRFWHHLGLFLTEENDGRIYPCTYMASSVLDALKTGLLHYQVDIIKGTKADRIRKCGNCFYVETQNGFLTAKRLIISAGGCAQKRIGGTDSGYTLLKSAGHHITDLCPALTPVLTDRKSVSGLSGLRVRGTVSILSNGKHVHSESGEILFTDDGISGICVLQCARFIDDTTDAALDLRPEKLKLNQDSLIQELSERKQRFSLMEPTILLNGIVPSKLSYAVCKQAGLPMKGERCGDVSQSQICKIADSLSNYNMRILGTRGFESAQVVAGGADCSEFDPRNMESKLLPGLHATGELLNVDGDCGGFNLMFAFASGILAGQNRRCN